MMKIQFIKFLCTIVNFIILVLILKHYFWDKIKSALEKRECSIEDRIMQAEEDAQKARRLRLDNEMLLKSAREEGKQLREEQKRKADKVYQEIVEDAHRESQTIIERARKEIEREEEKAKFELKEETINLALLLSTKALEDTIDEKQHRKLINDFISKVGI